MSTLVFPTPPQALCIDFDGTLVDSLPVLYAVYQSFMVSRSLPFSVEHFESLNGYALNEVVRQIREQFSLEEPEPLLYQEYVSAVNRLYPETVEPMPGAQELLETCQQLDIPVALVTASMSGIVQPVLLRFQWQGFFTHIITADQVVRAKPFPDLYQKALSQLGVVSPQSALAVEDSLNGVLAAQGAKIPVLLYQRDPLVIQLIQQQTTPDFYCTALQDLKNVL